MDNERAETNEGRDWENIEFNVASAATEITIHTGSGTSTATTKYLGKTAMATGFVLRTDKALEVLQIHTTVFKNPISVSTDGMSVSKHLRDFNTMVLRTTLDNTNIKLLVT